MQLMVGALSHRSAHAVLVSLLVHLAVWGPSMCPQAHSLSPCLRFSQPLADALLTQSVVLTEHYGSSSRYEQHTRRQHETLNLT
jgi:hypothetical protein